MFRFGLETVKFETFANRARVAGKPMKTNQKSQRLGSAAWLAAGLLSTAAWAQSPMAAPDTRLGEPLQSQVEASRKPVASDAAAVAALQPAADAPAETSAVPLAQPGEPVPLGSLISVGDDYKIGPNDLLDFDIFGVPGMQRTVRVNASGLVGLPLIGAVTLGGLTSSQAETLIAAKYAENYLQDPQISLFIKEFTTQRITIEGAVARPGIYPVVGQLTLLRALALAGGGGQFAKLDEVMLFRAGNTQAGGNQMFNLDKIRSGEVADPVINPDDVIVVKRDPRRTALRDSLFGDFLGSLNPLKGF
jgi:polysaccharide export outer membrane protein